MRCCCKRWRRMWLPWTLLWVHSSGRLLCTCLRREKTVMWWPSMQVSQAWRRGIVGKMHLCYWLRVHCCALDLMSFLHQLWWLPMLVHGCGNMHLTCYSWWKNTSWSRRCFLAMPSTVLVNEPGSARRQIFLERRYRGCKNIPNLLGPCLFCFIFCGIFCSQAKNKGCVKGDVKGLLVSRFFTTTIFFKTSVFFFGGSSRGSGKAPWPFSRSWELS